MILLWVSRYKLWFYICFSFHEPIIVIIFLKFINSNWMVWVGPLHSMEEMNCGLVCFCVAERAPQKESLLSFWVVASFFNLSLSSFIDSWIAAIGPAIHWNQKDKLICLLLWVIRRWRIYRGTLPFQEKSFSPFQLPCSLYSLWLKKEVKFFNEWD